MSKFCTNCGQQIDDNVSFCMNCGKNVRENNKTEDKVSSSVEKSDTFTPKSKIAAGLLGIFLGSFGVHNFYLGYTGKAVIQLLMTVLSCGILSFVSAVWSLIEGIMILAGSINTDAQGNPLGD